MPSTSAGIRICYLAVVRATVLSVMLRTVLYVKFFCLSHLSVQWDQNELVRLFCGNHVNLVHMVASSIDAVATISI